MIQKNAYVIWKIECGNQQSELQRKSLEISWFVLQSPRRIRTKRERGQKCVYLIKLWQKPFQTWRKKYIQVQEAQSIPNKINLNRATPRHIIIKVTKIKDEKIILKAAREKQLYTKGTPVNYWLISCRSFAETSLLVSKGNGMMYFKCWKGKPAIRILYPARLSFRTEGENFLDKQKLRVNQC